MLHPGNAEQLPARRVTATEVGKEASSVMSRGNAVVHHRHEGYVKQSSLEAESSAIYLIPTCQPSTATQ